MRIILIFLILICLIIPHACEQVKPNRIIPLENSLLWEISGNGLRSPSYLFGTNHFVGKNFADSLVGISHKFKMCKAVAGEIIIDTAALHKSNSGYTTPYYPLSKIFTPIEFASINKNLMRYTKFRLIELDQMKPTFIELLMLNAMSAKTINQSNPSLDEYFQEEGKKSGYKMIGLETMEFQVKLIFNTPIDDQKKHLLFFNEHIDKARKNLNDLIKLYKSQNIGGTDKLILSDMEYSPEETDNMLKDRNLNWMNKIPSIIKKQPTFIAVGLAHLLREYGLINQLRLKGYTVKPVRI